MLETLLDRERAETTLLRELLDQERRRFVDALRRDSGKPPIYAIPEPMKQPPLPPAIGTTGARIRDAGLEARKEEAQTGKPQPVRLPAAVGVTQALKRDKELERIRQNEIADEEAIVMAGTKVMGGMG